MIIAYVSNDDDWCALYFDGEKVSEGHSLRSREVLRLLKNCGQPVIEYTEYYADPANYSYGYPATFSEFGEDLTVLE